MGMFRVFSRVWVALVLLLAAAAATAPGTETASAQARTWRFGAALTLTGDGAGYGISQREGIELAVEAVNAAGGIHGMPIEVIFEDTRGDRTEAVNAVLKLINRDRVLAIIGPTNSGEMFVAGPVADRARVAIMGTSTTAVGIGEIGPYVFRTSMSEGDVLPVTVRVSYEKLGYRTAALLYSNNNDWAKSGAEVFQRELQALGVELVAVETFQDGDTDFRAQLTKVRSANPDVLVVSALYKESALLLQQARQLGLNQPVLGGNGFNSADFYEVAGEAAEGAIVGSPWFPGRDSDLVRDFVARYTERYGKRPDQFVAQAYDGMLLFAEAARISGNPNDRQGFRNALASIRNFEGVTGLFSFDDHGNPLMEARVLQIRRGVYELLE